MTNSNNCLICFIALSIYTLLIVIFYWQFTVLLLAVPATALKPGNQYLCKFHKGELLRWTGKLASYSGSHAACIWSPSPSLGPCSLSAVAAAATAVVLASVWAQALVPATALGSHGASDCPGYPHAQGKFRLTAWWVHCPLLTLPREHRVCSIVPLDFSEFHFVLPNKINWQNEDISNSYKQKYIFVILSIYYLVIRIYFTNILWVLPFKKNFFFNIQ